MKSTLTGILTLPDNDTALETIHFSSLRALQVGRAYQFNTTNAVFFVTALENNSIVGEVHAGYDISEDGQRIIIVRKDCVNCLYFLPYTVRVFETLYCVHDNDYMIIKDNWLLRGDASRYSDNEEE